MSERPLGARLRAYHAAAATLAAVIFRVFGFRRDVIRDNLARAFPDRTVAERARLARDHVSRQSEVLAESWYALGMSADELRERVVISNPELLAAGVPGKPLVLAGAHHCNWEWMSLRLSLEYGERYLALYKPPKNARVERFLVRLRTRFEGRLVPAKSILRELANFRQGAAVALLADQVPRSSPDRHWTRFLGLDTAFFMGAELLGRALRTRVVFVHMRRLARGRYTVDLVPLNEPGEKAEQGAITERYARALETCVLEDPAGWLWSHRRWKLTKP